MMFYMEMLRQGGCWQGPASPSRAALGAAGAAFWQWGVPPSITQDLTTLAHAGLGERGWW